MPGSSLWIGLGMSIGILLAWDGTLMAVDAENQAATLIAVQAERSLAAVQHGGGKFKPLAPVEQQEWLATIHQLQSAIVAEDEATIWLAIVKLKLLADRYESQSLRIVNRRRPGASRAGTAWEVTIGPGYVRSGSPLLAPASCPGSPAAIHELVQLQSQLHAWTPRLKSDSNESLERIVCPEPICSLDRNSVASRR